MKSQKKLFFNSFFITFATLILVFLTTYLAFFENSPFKATPVNDPIKTPKGAQLTILLTAKKDNTSAPDHYTLLSFNPTTSTVSTVTFPKNTAVYLNKKTVSLQTSYNNAGAQKVMECLNETYSTKISYYMDLTYEELAQVIDTFGAIPYNVFENIEEKQDNQTIFKLESGEQLLNGAKITGLIQYCSLTYNEKVILVGDLTKTFFVHNMRKDHLQDLSTNLDTLLNGKKTSLSTVGTQKLEHTLQQFDYDNVKLIYPTMSGIAEKDIFYLDDGSINLISEICKK